MKKYIFLLFLSLLWSTLSPFVAFRVLQGSFTPKEIVLSQEDQLQSSQEVSDTTPSHNLFPSEEESKEEHDEGKELLTAYLISKTDYEKYSPECQKALAVAIRSQIYYEGRKDSIQDIPEEIPQCVLETKGIIMTHDGKAINGIYHTSSYKTTVSSQNGEKYLLSVSTFEDLESIKKEIIFSKDEMKEIISELCPTSSFDSEKIITQVKYDEENRCKYINSGNCAISAQALTDRLNLPSLAFEVTENESNVVFTAYGEGNGLGMSLEGAQYLCNAGKSFEEILKYYYTGIEIEKAE